ncbi:hypothetical protein DFW101_0325 [Solidesulfovibrio carbinoliphilus subsp. oakridgensis]|uniref:Uncharacterized protein n=1 Tax=Solidesulfovibrio carbinoliphilus subsp. oakridgensis TaxID=694327 RepID=G7QD36_9BACT|nr:hypothetical protein [Solidesulfovibrio carbinoliphilus]EHJ46342.1 hypothetical protein DFW101_0325 [Solidesulfovibrio carbinoliphilus subsp. oakridgensis]
MTIFGKTATINYDDQRARGEGHSPVIVSRKLKAGQGVLPVGLLLARDAAGEAVPFEVVAAEELGTGTGATKAYAGTLAKAPVQPETVAVTDGVETFGDDGCGRLAGSAGGTGTVNYKTGAVAVTFAANVGNGVAVDASYGRRLHGVLDEVVDTAASGSGLAVVHGSVRKDVLKVGIAAPAAPSAAVLAWLSDSGIWPN